MDHEKSAISISGSLNVIWYQFTFSLLTIICSFSFSAYLQQMLMDGWSVFAIRGSLPQPSKALSDNGRGEWISVRSVSHSGRVAPSSASHSNNVIAIDDDDELQRALAMSMETHVVEAPSGPGLPVLDEVPEHEPNALNLMVHTGFITHQVLLFSIFFSPNFA
jgi:hypothetical protein